jgi:hypothetical protein
MSQRLRQLTVACLLVAAGLFAQSVSAAPDNPYYPPAGEWAHKKPAEVGMDAAKLAEAVADRHTVHSFDHVAINDRVVACDIAHTPLDDETLDVAIFSLSLMGSNFADYLREAHRTLKVWRMDAIMRRSGDALSVADVAAQLPHKAFRRCTWRDGTKNPLRARFDSIGDAAWRRDMRRAAAKTPQIGRFGPRQI